MDPNETYRKIKSIIATHSDSGWATMTLEEVHDLADGIEALDKWLKGGGFLPKAWERKEPTK